MSKILTSKQRIMAFLQLGHILQNPDEQLSSLISSAKHYNAWFTPQSTAMAIHAIAEMLNESDLEKWIDANTDEPIKTNAIGLILAGNIPLVGFHDILCVLASGNKALIKLYTQDKHLIPYI